MALTKVSRYDEDQISNVGDHAVVVGGSIAGLVTARVLTDAFGDVTIVERDPLPDEPVARRGVPQSNQAHVLIEAGRATLEDLFVGFGEEFLSAGGLLIDAATNFRYHIEGDFVASGPERLPLYCGSRPLLEQVVRRLVTDLDSVTVRSNCQCTDYLVDDSETSVRGVAIQNADSRREELDADLVVDATGRTSKTPTWLEEHGYRAPTVDELQVDVAYSTTIIERPPDDRRTYTVPPSPPRTRAGFAIPIENGQWEVTMQGIHGDDPPTDAEKFKEFAGTLPTTDVKTLLEEQAWVSEEIHHYPFPSSVRRRYEKLDRFPDGLLVVGDAIASFNPIYGQGMSVAALEAVILHHALASGGLEDLPLRFFDRAEGVIDDAWQIAVGGDFKFPQTEGSKPPGTDLFNRYLARLARRAHSDGVLADAFIRMVLFERPYTSLLRPSIAKRVLLPNF